MFFIILILLNIYSIAFSSDSNSCFYNTSYKYVEKDYIRLYGFSRLDAIKFACSRPVQLEILEFRSSTKLILTDKLNTSGLALTPFYNSICVSFINFKGFDLIANPFASSTIINYKSEEIHWIITGSNFEFYLNEKPLECNTTLMNNNWYSNMFMNSNLLMVQFSKLSKLCPIIFRNSFLIIFRISRISDSLLNKNLLSFEDLKTNDDLNSNIIQFKTQLYHVNLSSTLLNKNVFEKLLILDVSGQIDVIEETLFKKLSNLKMIRFSAEKVRNLFSRNNKWINYLNFGVTSKDLKEKFLFLIIYQSFENYSLYTYPDEDFCLFQEFPHTRNVFPKLRPNFKTSCSCTELFLIQHSYKVKSFINDYTQNVFDTYYFVNYYTDVLEYESNFSYCINESIKDYIHDCHFIRRLKRCDLKTKENVKLYFYLNDWYELSRESLFLFSTYLNPIFSLVIITINVIMIGILNKIKSAPNCVRMYDYLRANTCFHLIYLILQSLRLIMDCNFIDLFCSVINESIVTQAFNIYIVKFIGNSIRTASNISHISITLSRYIIVINKQDSFLAKFNRINFKLYLLVVVLLSLLINVSICFEYSLEASISYFKTSNKDHDFYVKKQSPADDFIENFSTSTFSILTIFRFIKIFFSDLMYIIFSLTLDLILLRYVKSKRKTVKSCKADLKKSQHFSLRLTAMIIFNGINFSLFRLPSSILMLYGFFYRYDENSFEYKPNVVGYIVCRIFMFCSCLGEYFYFIYLNSFIVQFFILIYLDKNFKKSFENFQVKVWKKFDRVYLS